MDPRVHAVFKKHEEWLEKGGDQAVQSVQQANLASHLETAMAELESASYQAGWDACLEKMREKASRLGAEEDQRAARTPPQTTLPKTSETSG